MVNYSNVFADVLAEYESLYVPGDQGDAGKGQVCVRAGYRIHTTIDANVGYIGKNPGQTQFYGVAVDALKDRSDGTGADYLTDELQADGRRLIKLAYTPYAPPPPGPPPIADWIQPTAAYLDYPGPLVLKGDTPIPEPVPPAENKDDEILAAIAGVVDTLADMQAQQAADTSIIMARDDANTEKIQQQIRDLVEDVEESLMGIAKLLLIMRRRNDDDDTPAAASGLASAVDSLCSLITSRQVQRAGDA